MRPKLFKSIVEKHLPHCFEQNMTDQEIIVYINSQIPTMHDFPVVTYDQLARYARSK